MDNLEIESVKDAAHKMVAFLATKNIKIKHTVMLEALSQGFDMQNWRTLRAKLDGSPSNATSVPTRGSRFWKFSFRTSKANEIEPVLIESDNLLQAVVYLESTLVKRGFKTIPVLDDVTIVNSTVSVINDARTLLQDCQKVTYGDAIENVLKYAKKGIGEPPSRGITECEEYEEKYAPISLVMESLSTFKNSLMIDHVEKMEDFLKDFGQYDEIPSFEFDMATEVTIYSGVDGEFVIQSVYDQALETVGSIDSLNQSLQISFMKVKALIDYLPDVINYVLWDKYKDGSAYQFNDD